MRDTTPLLEGGDYHLYPLRTQQNLDPVVVYQKEDNCCSYCFSCLCFFCGFIMALIIIATLLFVAWNSRWCFQGYGFCNNNINFTTPGPGPGPYGPAPGPSPYGPAPGPSPDPGPRPYGVPFWEVDGTGGDFYIPEGHGMLSHLHLTVWPNSVASPTKITVNYTEFEVLYSQLKNNVFTSSHAFVFSTNISEFTFLVPALLSLPVPMELNNTIRFYSMDTSTSKLYSTSYVGMLTNNTLLCSIWVSSFATGGYVAVSTPIFWNASITSLFDPLSDGWGDELVMEQAQAVQNSLGSLAFMQWYNYQRSLDPLMPSLSSKAKTVGKDSCIRLMARASLGAVAWGVWDGSPQQMLWIAKSNPEEIAVTWLHGLIVTEMPQLALFSYNSSSNEGYELSGNSMVALIYGYNSSTSSFIFLDPRFPLTEYSSIMFLHKSMFSGWNVSIIGPAQLLMESREDAIVNFNLPYALSSDTFIPLSGLESLYEMEFLHPGSTNYSSPIITLNSNNVTDVDNIVLFGKLLGIDIRSGLPWSELISSIDVYVQSISFTAPVESASGIFSVQIPLMDGTNDIYVVANPPGSSVFNGRTSVLPVKIKNTMLNFNAITITLQWFLGSSDVDLHVLEPDGSHVYFSNKYNLPYPYLDFDNTIGYGPEHFIAQNTVHLPSGGSLNGIYQYRVHYYAGMHLFVPYRLKLSYITNIDSKGKPVMSNRISYGLVSNPGSTGSSNFFSTGSNWGTIFNFDFKSSGFNLICTKKDNTCCCKDILNKGVCKSSSQSHAPIINGCGSENGVIIKLPWASITEACNQHDICYDTCNNNKDTCDSIFERAMGDGCFTIANPVERNSCFRITALLYIAVSWAGWDSFTAAQSSRCSCMEHK